MLIISRLWECLALNSGYQFIFRLQIASALEYSTPSPFAGVTFLKTHENVETAMLEVKTLMGLGEPKTHET
jgi:hypothetical protein